jgi:hypothetical protein
MPVQRQRMTPVAGAGPGATAVPSQSKIARELVTALDMLVDGVEKIAELEHRQQQPLQGEEKTSLDELISWLLKAVEQQLMGNVEKLAKELQDLPRSNIAGGIPQLEAKITYLTKEIRSASESNQKLIEKNAIARNYGGRGPSISRRTRAFFDWIRDVSDKSIIILGDIECISREELDKMSASSGRRGEHGNEPGSNKARRTTP